MSSKFVAERKSRGGQDRAEGPSGVQCSISSAVMYRGTHSRTLTLCSAKDWDARAPFCLDLLPQMLDFAEDSFWVSVSMFSVNQFIRLPQINALQVEFSAQILGNILHFSVSHQKKHPKRDF